MINSIDIENFQSHNDTHIELVPGVNAFIGPSDSGKTAIFRAINWVVNSRPVGNDFHSWNGKDPRVGLDLSEGILVCRGRHKGENFYTITLADGEEQQLKAFGQRVPDEISKILNLSDINFQSQLSGPFLLSQSPGDTAKYLNKVVDLDIIDIALANINKRLRQEDNDFKYAQSEAERLEAAAKEFDWLDEAEGCLSKLEAAESVLLIEKKKKAILHETITYLKNIGSRIKSQDVILKHDKKVHQLLELNNEIEDLAKKADNLHHLIVSIENIEKELAQTIPLLKAEKEIEKALVLNENIDSLHEQMQQLYLLKERIRDNTASVKAEEMNINELQQQYDKLMPQICPLCGNEVKKTRRNQNHR